MATILYSCSLVKIDHGSRSYIFSRAITYFCCHVLFLQKSGQITNLSSLLSEPSVICNLPQEIPKGCSRIQCAPGTIYLIRIELRWPQYALGLPYKIRKSFLYTVSPQKVAYGKKKTTTHLVFVWLPWLSIVDPGQYLGGEPLRNIGCYKQPLTIWNLFQI